MELANRLAHHYPPRLPPDVSVGGQYGLEYAFLQGEEYGATRDVVCQLPPEAGHPPCIALGSRILLMA